MKIKDIKTGTKLSLEVFNQLDEKIQDNLISQFESLVGNDRIIIYAPITKGKLFPIHIGWTINVMFFNDENLYRFQAKVINRFTVNNIPFLEAVVTSSIERIQRRAYFRLQCFIPVEYRVFSKDNNDEETPFKKCVAINISGSGLCLKMKEELNIDDIIECKFVINKRELKPICQVVRVESEIADFHFGYMIGTKFIKLSKQDVDRIVSFIFKEQIKLRRKGLI
ncbi:MAG TPA: hypothetical protein GXX20_02150 [Clostridiaceae bacterium]|nr:hypothetical protein [Clostridiaceae bacterium]